MGALSGCRALAWALMALVLQKAETQGIAELSWPSAEGVMESQMVDTAQQLTFIQPIEVFPTMSTLNPAHNGRVCSTWGDFHYKTFDGDVFHFPGRCNYVFSAHCGTTYEDFNIQLRRGLAGSRPTITHVILKTQGLVLEFSNGSVLIDGRREELPYSRAGLLVEQSSDYIQVNVRLVLTFTWNGEDSALLELDPKYANQTCGLCGDFNGLPAVNEFYAHNARLTPLQFGNLQKLDGPTEQCQDPPPSEADNCTDGEGICHRTLLGPALTRCNWLVDPGVYVAACAQDLCRCPTCPCATFAEYSRQCAHAGGQPQNWRGPDLCRTVLDDVTNTGCLPLEQCPCTHGGHTYAPGASFTTSCLSCTCSGGLWQCQDLPCPGTCSVQGGSHISTYDEKLYDVHGDCSYVLSKKCADSGFTVLGELRKCGLTDNEICLKAVTLSVAMDMTIQIQASGGVFVNSIYTQLPVSAGNVTIFRPSTFFVLVQTGLGLQLEVQLVPTMQVFLRLDPAHRGQMCGLCGNFNRNQADDFRTLSGVVEGTAAAFANTWKTQATCPNVKNSFEDPCSLSVENENYAQHWCSLLTKPDGAFSPCHSVVSPASFHSNCLFDTCNCEKSEDCLCAALSSYVRACAAKGVLLSGWRDGVCTKYMSSCPKSQKYAYMVDGCQPTCRALSQADVTCGVSFVPVDGCTCPHGTFLDDAGACVSAEACPCYFHGSMVAPGEVVHDNGVMCSCASGKLSCLGAVQTNTGCVAPMVYLDCSNASAGTPGAECLRSCHTLDVDCFSTHCVSGCVCPPGLVSDGSGGCVAEDDCPCQHNEVTYRPGDIIRVDCNTCTCRNRRWECSHRPCLGTCVAYGDGHFITFDGERYSFDGSCQYTLAQDHCGGNSTTNGTFRIVTENVPCGTTGVTCSKAIKIFLENYELILHSGTHKVVQRGPGGDLPYRIRYMGTHLAVETRSGLLVSWDRKTSVFIRLHQDYKGRVCGLCGNFDDNAVNDFTTRSRSVVGDVLEFGNSWKFSPSCPDAPAPRDPCTANPSRKSWAQKQCSIITGAAFTTCHSQVDSTKYYEACVSDACACDSGGDCECFCTAVAAYAQACRDVGVCVSWRTPDVCPLFCDYYNPHGECEWHYQPCGAPCLKTCRNPSGHCLMDLPGLEGCYPKCPPSKPFFSEDQMKCVAQCGCYDQDGNYYDVGTSVPTAENCQSCDCTPSGLQCTHSLAACKCSYEGRTYGYGDTIYNTTDGLGACLIAICGNNGTITRSTTECPRTLSTTPFTFTSTTALPSTTGPVSTLPTVCVHQFCRWSAWYDSDHPEPGMGSGDFETFVNLRQRGHQVCLAPASVECRARQLPDTPLEQLGQKVECSLERGLTCLNSEQSPPICHNYELRVLCCDLVPCSTPQGSSTSQGLSLSTPALQTTVAFTSQTQPATPTTITTRTAGSSVAQSTTCQPRCQWTEWFDKDYPKSEEAGGDIESFDRIRSAGGAVCPQPQDIECRAENFPNRTPEELGQRVHCDPSFGLVCRNDEQVGLFKMCLNYRIRVLCCSHDHCGELTTATSALITATNAATAVTSSITTTTSSKPSASQAPLGSTTAVSFLPTEPMSSATSPSPRHTDTLVTSATRSPTSPPGSTKPSTTSLLIRTTPQGTTGGTPQGPTTGVETMRTTTAHSTLSTAAGTVATSPPSPSHTGMSTQRTQGSAITEATTSQGTTGCQPKCEWTEWFDVDFPTSGVRGGDMETYDNIRAAGGKMCREPQKIECRAESYPEVSLDQIGQVVSCSLRAGLVCRNQDQRGPFNMCFNYNVRVLCCDHMSHCPTASTLPPTTPTPASPSVSRTTPVGTSHKHTTPGSLPTGTSMGEWSSVVTGLRTTATTKTYLSSPRTMETVPIPTSLRTTETGTIRSTTFTPKPSTTMSAPPSAPRTAHLVTTPIQTTAMSLPTSPTFGTTLPSSTLMPGSFSTTTTSQTTGNCTPRCAWTDWFDADYPKPIPNGGDFETYANIRAAGEPICEKPQALECRAETLPDVPLQQVGQVVLCRLEEGLVCRNRDQRGRFKMCLNYHIRVLCCDNRHCPTTPATTAVTSPGTSLRPTSLTTPSPTVVSSASTTATPRCQPACRWTDWQDSDRPRPGPYGGDVETYIQMEGLGSQLCAEPDAIECEAVLFPGVPLEQLGQVVLCDPEYGLICRNNRQGWGQTCFNYHIRVRCCDDYSHCPSTATATSTSTGKETTALWTTATTQSLSSSPGTTQRVTTATTETGPSSPGTTQRVTMPTTETGPSSPGTTQRVTTATTETGPSSPGTTQSVASHTTQTPLASFRTTERASVSSLSASTGTPPTNTKPAWPSTPHKVPLVTTPIQTTQGSLPTGPTFGTTLPSSPLTPGPSSTTMTSPTTGDCTPRCAWTDWFDADYPKPGPNGGDFETFDMLRLAGHVFCERPQDIECRSEKAPDVSLTDVGQVVQCNVSFGLVCRNRDQPGRVPYCHNFHVRLLCCDRHCTSPPGTTAGTSLSPKTSRTPLTPTTIATTHASSLPSAGSSTASTGTSQVQESSTSVTISPTMPELGTTLRPSTAASTTTVPQVNTQTSAILTPSPTTSVTKSTSCQPRCAWTDWLDQTYPVPGPSGGDFETFANIRAAGEPICEKPQALECRAETLPDVPLQQVGQVVLCRLEEGLVCRNRDQRGRFKMCLNYHIRVLCCDNRHCPTTPATTAVTSPGTSLRPTSLTTPSPTVVSSASTTATPRCQPACRWTDWQDSDRPRPGPYGGDVETYIQMEGLGSQLCAEPDAIECEAVLFPGVPLEQLGQVVLCDPEYGLICRNNRQGWGQTCFNYHIRVRCCDDYSHCPSTATATSTSTGKETTALWTTATTQSLSSSPGTTQRVTTATTETGPSSPGTTQRVTSHTTQTPLASFRTTERASVSSLSASTGTPPTNTKPAWPSTPHKVPLVTTPIQTTAMSLPTSPTFGTTLPSSTLMPGSFSTTTTSQTTGNCTPRCAWTDWFDADYPKPIPNGGDFETYANIRAAGEPICEKPQALECRAETLPDVPLQQVGQVVLCRLEEGLVCRNRDQRGRFKMCLNYHIRVLCCDNRHCPTTPATTAVTSPGTSLRPTSLTTPSPTVVSSASTTATPRCQPACRWTDWQDSDRPRPGPYGGDVETYIQMEGLGSQLCAEPDAIECEAVLFPGVPLEQLGQVVLCDPEYGLICRNNRQGWGQTCFNYHIRVRCCDDYSHCPSTATATSTSTGKETTALWTTATTQSLSSSPGTTQRVTTATTETGPSSPGTTQRVTTATTETGPSSPGTTQSVASHTTQTPLASFRTTERASVSSLSASTGTPPTNTKPAWPSTPHKVPLVTTPIQTTQGSLPTGPTFGTTLPSSPLTPGPSSTTMTSPTTGDCTPRCAWTDWFDADYPKPGPNGGDFETFDMLRLAGHVFCERPQDIECRSEKAPDVSLTDVGQVVQCNVSFGLVCRNRDQPGRVPYCHNFHVRLLCCDRHCTSPPGTTASTPQLLKTSPSLTPATMSPSVLSTLRPNASPSSPVPTTPCLCRAFGQLFSPGDVVYNRSDGAGCHFYAICSPHCELERFQGACSTSAPPEPPSSVSPTSPTSPTGGCDLTVPPRQVNETWTLEDCTLARCEGDNRIVLLEPEPVTKVTCVNGHLPVRVQSQQDPCQYHYECECTCSSWGGSNYITFDGTSYSFRDNCTHVVMREIRPRHGNLTILLNNYFCAAPAASPRCPRALSVHYESMEIVLTTSVNADGQEESLVLFDHVRVSQGFSKNGVRVSVTVDAAMHVDIPAIGVSVTFHGEVFQVRLSYSHFSHNTEGQCGTCTNNKMDDCRRPDGTMAPTCQDMGNTWLVPESSKEGCWAPTGPPPTTSSPAPVTTTPFSTQCPPAPLCELMLSQVFTECHDLIPPGAFFSTCVSDSCQAGRPEVPCQSLEAYAALCRARGVCSNWRNATAGLCDLTCPPAKVYQPCGPKQPMTCDSGNQSPENEGLVEGCFCPDGHTLFNSYTDVCVPKCPCVGPDGFPKFPGEQWVSDCQTCVCDEDSVSVQCVPVQCEPQDRPLECSRPGFLTVTRPLANNPCCPETLCVCNTTTCPLGLPQCGPGEELTRTQEEGSCCPTFGCRPKLCIYNGTVYGVGATFPAVTPCHTCTCLSVDTQNTTVQCEEDACNTTCPQGSEYSRVAGQCCGECVQTACLTPHGGLVQPNETWVNSLVDNCTEYHCQAENGVPVLTPRPAPCPDVPSCRGTLRKTGCCYSCEEVDTCQVRVNRTVLRHRDCEAPVNVTFCEGSCPGVSKYSVEAQTMQRQCTCCQETRTHKEVVTMQCPDGTAVQHTYTHVDDCSCTPACIPSPAAPEDGKFASLSSEFIDV
ncbi:hypothetical protein mRhiFer1_008228 [Rhinolophus ferrumequinum]|uniref:Mucin 5B, oligomeric mucus/gel-forming n=1 Tax=Rhinolophus ferrumequinum TaxID=59479 RepID=A0A7J7W7U2_RHIFE|nr:hypothetical protein mRhiFer1_008228 [Rhinolophus ferrumequinum]